MMLSGCAKTINQPSASIPLVDKITDANATLVPENYWDALGSASIGTQIKMNFGLAEVVASYISANGETCKKLQSTEQSIKFSAIQTVCKSDASNQWRFAKNILSSSLPLPTQG
jgi:hypothetical protein